MPISRQKQNYFKNRHVQGTRQYFTLSFCRYCNSRIALFDKNGKYVAHFGEDEFWTPHSLALIEELDMICVADRDDERYTDRFKISELLSSWYQKL